MASKGAMLKPGRCWACRRPLILRSRYYCWGCCHHVCPACVLSYGHFAQMGHDKAPRAVRTNNLRRPIGTQP